MSEPTTPPSTEPATQPGPQVSVHRWPWRAEEFVSMAIVFALTLALGYFVFSARRETMSPAFTLALLILTVVGAFGSVYYLYRVKKKRTDVSQVTITIMGTKVRVESRGPLGKSQVDVANTETVSYRKFNSDETFMISEGDNGARIPVRATKDANVRRIVEMAFAKAENVSGEARTLYTEMGEAEQK